MIVSLTTSERTPNLCMTLTKVWLQSVKASHLFLSSEDIESLIPSVEQGLWHIPTLLVAYDANKAIGFLGIENRKIEMLFVSPDHMGKGYGKALLCMAIEKYHTNLVDVNEQNPTAKSFYEHFSFVTYARTEVDDAGRPFPLLKMKLAEEKLI